jgi:hypothetical protein
MLSGDYLEGGGGIMVLAGSPVQVIGGEETDHDIELIKGARISGKVTSVEDGSPVSGVSVMLSGLNNQFIGGFAVSDKNCEYSIGSILPDRYSVCAEGGGGGIYLKQWYDQIQPQREESNLGYYSYYYNYAFTIITRFVMHPFQTLHDLILLVLQIISWSS